MNKGVGVNILKWELIEVKIAEKQNIRPHRTAEAVPASFGNVAMAPELPVGTKNPKPSINSIKGNIRVYKLKGLTQ